MNKFLSSNLSFGLLTFSIILNIIIILYAFTITVICEDLNGVISMQDTYIEELKYQCEK